MASVGFTAMETAAQPQTPVGAPHIVDSLILHHRRLEDSQPQTPVGSAPHATADMAAAVAPRVKLGIDLSGSGEADLYFEGPDADGDGIPDQLQADRHYYRLNE